MIEPNSLLWVNDDTRIQGWFDFHDIYSEMVAKLLELKRPLVEVGSWRGRSTVFLARTLKDSKAQRPFPPIYAVDTWEGTASDPAHALLMSELGIPLFNEFMGNLKFNGVDELVFPIQRESLRAARHFKDGELAGCFIDGDHSYDSVYADLEAWYPKVCAGGIFAGHDYFWGEVSLALRHFCKGRNLTVVVRNKSWEIK